MEVLNPGLDIFVERPFQTSIVDTHTVPCKPLTSADNPAQLEFHYSGHSDRYAVLNSVTLDLQLKLVKTDGSDITASDNNEVGCVNNPLHSMFSSYSISLNGKVVTLHEGCYPHKALLGTLLNFGSDSLNTHLLGSLMINDTPGTDGKLTAVKGNKGYESRLAFLNNSKTITLSGKFHADLFNTNKMLLNGVNMDIKLTRAPETFYLLGPTNDTKVRIKIEDATLRIDQVEIKSPILEAHTKALVVKKKNAHYPITHTQIKTFTVGSGVQHISLNNAFTGPVPERLLVALVKNSSFVGSVSSNPFEFKHYNMTQFVLYVNGVPHPSQPLTMDCSSTMGVTRAYHTLFSSTGIHYGDRGHMITQEMFTKGYFILGFDLTPDREADEDHYSLTHRGNVTLEARFKEPLPEAVTCILYAEFPGYIEIDSSRNVTVA
jgi:hypothetical protein